MKVSVSIMAHPKRKDWVPTIHKKLGFECPVAWDQIQDRWDTGKRAWLLHDPTATHHLVLQDDVILSRDLMIAVHNVVRHAPGFPVSIFARNKRSHKWNQYIDACRRTRANWLMLQRLNWGPGVILPVADIKPMIEWIDRCCFMPNYDVRIAYYYLAVKKVPTYYTMPSLIDHRIEGKSLVWTKMGSQHKRFARYFIGKEKSGATIKWQRKIIKEQLSMGTYLRKTIETNEKYKALAMREAK